MEGQARYKTMLKYKVLDRRPRYQVVQNDIQTIQNELYRLSQSSRMSWDKVHKMRTLSKQIDYLEELLAKLEEDQKKKFD